ILDLGNPLDAIQWHAIFMLENAAHPQHRRRHHRLHADFSAVQIRRLRNAFCSVDEHETVSKTAMEKYRNGPEWQSVVTRGEIRRCGNLGYIEFAVAQESPVTRRRIHLRQDRQIHAINLDLLIEERADDFIITTGERKRDFLQHSKL